MAQAPINGGGLCPAMAAPPPPALYDLMQLYQQQPGCATANAQAQQPRAPPPATPGSSVDVMLTVAGNLPDTKWTKAASWAACGTRAKTTESASGSGSPRGPWTS